MTADVVCKYSVGIARLDVRTVVAGSPSNGVVAVGDASVTCACIRRPTLDDAVLVPSSFR